MLEQLGYTLKTVDNARQALELFAAQPDQFDLVITDMTMPGLTGDKFAGELRKIDSDIPILLCTGYSELISREKAKALGINGFLMKPFGIKEFADIVRKILDQAFQNTTP